MNTPQDRFDDRDKQATGSGAVLSGDTDDAVQDAADKVKAEGREQVDHYRNVAADEVDRLADSARAAASELDGDELGGRLSQHISELADSMGRLSSGLREKSGDELLGDVRRMARDNPTLFLAGSIAIGFGLTRFARASTPSGHPGERDGRQPAVDWNRQGDHGSQVAGVAGNPSTSGLGAGATSGSGLAGGAPGSSTLASGGNLGNTASENGARNIGGSAGLGGRPGGGTLSDAALGTAAGTTAGSGLVGDQAAAGDRSSVTAPYNAGPEQSNGRKSP